MSRDCLGRSLNRVFHTGSLILADVITFGPYGFHNEPFFAPSLTLPKRNLRVTALMMQKEMFDSSFLREVCLERTKKNLSTSRESRLYFLGRCSRMSI